MGRVCFDHLSGTPVSPELLAAMEPWFSANFSGTGAVHSGGVEARAALDEARERVAQFIGASSPEEIIFTSSGTEALNLAVKGCALANQRRGKNILLSAIEHPAVQQSVEFLQTLGFTSKSIGVSSEGRINSFADSLDDQTTLICAHAGHHDIGVIQDLKAIGEVAADKGVSLLVDATYAGGWMELDVEKTNASYLALAPHRFKGPKGVGILYKRRRAQLTPLIHGGAQELGWHAGTENIPAIVGAGVACEMVRRNLVTRIQNARALQTRMWNGIREKIKGVRLNGPEPGSHRLPNSLNFSITGVEGEGLALSLDMKGFAVTSGQACATKASKVPAVLAALGVDEEFGPGTIILSFGEENTAAEVERFLQIFPATVEKLRALSE
jgi:cysteine desulfurase